MSSGVKQASEEVMGESVSGEITVATLIAMTEFESPKVHSLFFAIQGEQGCCRSHLHLAMTQGVHDFRLDLDGLGLLERVVRCEWRWIDYARTVFRIF
jgi:hypothetical protein